MPGIPRARRLFFRTQESVAELDMVRRLDNDQRERMEQRLLSLRGQYDGNGRGLTLVGAGLLIGVLVFAVVGMAGAFEAMIGGAVGMGFLIYGIVSQTNDSRIESEMQELRRMLEKDE